MKIIVYGNSPNCKTAYGIYAHTLAKLFIELGHEVIQVANTGINQGSTVVFDGIPCMSCDHMGVEEIAKVYEADFVLSYMDLWCLTPDITDGCRLVAYFPFDAEPMPKGYAQIIPRCFDVITETRHGVRQLEDGGFPGVARIPHAVDNAEFYVTDKTEARAAMNLVNKDGSVFSGTLFSIVGDNNHFPSRKAHTPQLIAFKKYLENDPSALLYLHCISGTSRGGENLAERVVDLGLQESVIFCEQTAYKTGAFDVSYMRNVYNATDVLMAVSTFEGFCVPLIEAQACGTPVIASGWLAQPENVASGLVVSKDDAEMMPMAWGGYCWYPHVDGIVKAMNDVRLFVKKSTLKSCLELSEKIHGTFGLKTVVKELWKSKLTEIEKKIKEVQLGCSN